MNWYLDVLKKYAVFSGRARRKEYWMFVLFNILAFIVLAIIDNMTGTFNPLYGAGLLGGLVLLIDALGGGAGGFLSGGSDGGI